MRASESFNILVTDINHHVRDLLKRELEKEGYTVFSVKSEAQVHQYICSPNPFDLIILDPELYHPFNHNCIDEILQQRGSSLLIIIHTYSDSDILKHLKRGGNLHLVEKNAKSIDSLKEKIRASF